MTEVVRNAGGGGSDRGSGGGGVDVHGGGGPGDDVLGEVLRGGPANPVAAPVRVPGYGTRFRRQVREENGPDASGIEGTGTIRVRFENVIREVPEFAGVQVEQLPAFRIGIAADAIINLSSARGIETGQQMLFFFNNNQIVRVSRVAVLSAMFGTADFENVQLTRVHRGVWSEITQLLKDADFVSTMTEDYGISEVAKRMDYLRGNFRFDRAGRAAAVESALSAAAE